MEYDIDIIFEETSEATREKIDFFFRDFLEVIKPIFDKHCLVCNQICFKKLKSENK